MAPRWRSVAHVMRLPTGTSARSQAADGQGHSRDSWMHCLHMFTEADQDQLSDALVSSLAGVECAVERPGGS